MENSIDIRKCTKEDFDDIFVVINDGAEVYRGVIPADRFHDPYMSKEHLQGEIDAGVEFWGIRQNAVFLGVMGIQDVLDVTLIRHAYVRTEAQRKGIGGALLMYLLPLTSKPVLIGTWQAARWAIAFYKKHGFYQVGVEEKNRLLAKYWSIPERQIETSVVLRQVE